VKTLNAKALSLLLAVGGMGFAPGVRGDDKGPIATVNGEPIPREEANGLNYLLLNVQLKVARQEAAKQGIVIKPEDIEAERNTTMKGLFPDSEPKDYPELVEQLLAKQGISKPQYELIIQTNAALRKIAEPQCVGKITEENIQQAFDLKYGAKVQIRDIKLGNVASAQRAKQRLAAGESWDLVSQMTADEQTRANGGLWPPFGAAATGISEAIKDEAWRLKVGDVSDIISTEGAWHIIKVEQRIPPPAKIVKLDKEKHDYLMKELTEKYVQQVIKVMRVKISEMVQQQGVLDIRDPVLKAQFDKQLAEAKRLAAEKDKQSMPDMIQRLKASSRPATEPK
jgi:parvulin-like peptidyl-prolyl isomerase